MVFFFVFFYALKCFRFYGGDGGLCGEPLGYIALANCVAGALTRAWNETEIMTSPARGRGAGGPEEKLVVVSQD